VSVALVIQHAKCMCHIMSSVTCPALPHYLINDTLFEKEVLEYKICALIFSTANVWSISHSKKNWVRCDHKCVWSSCKVPVVLVRFYWSLYFCNRFLKNTKISNFMKIGPVGAELFHAVRQMDMMTLITAFFNFVNTPKNVKCRCVYFL
jgi:hypothetical protein